MNENRNMILAIVLSAMVLLGWSLLADKIMPTATPQTQTVHDGKVTPKADAAPVAAAPAPAAPTGPVKLADALRGGQRVRIDTPALAGSINLKGARFDDLLLKSQKRTMAADSLPVRLLSPSGTARGYFADFGWSAQNLAVPTADTVWTADQPLLTPTQPVTLSWANLTGQAFRLTISVDKDYLFTVKQSVTNAGTGAVAVTPYGRISRARKSTDPSSWTQHVGPLAYLDGKARYDVDWKTIDEGKEDLHSNSNGGWLGFTDKYWLTALAPTGEAPLSATFRKNGNTGGYQADYSTQPQMVAPGATATLDTRLFAGAKEYVALKSYEAAGIPSLNRAIDWGWFRWFMIPIFNLLLWLFKATGNFGVAILGLTLIVRTLMFPIANKQFKSMAAMRTLQPKMKAVQERWKDDKARQQQEILKLYQEEKVNPAAGCLPILLQIPVFYALYKVLMVSVEMRHQPFALWIHDLSAADPLTPVNLFGLLHFTPPAMLAIGVLPLLMGVTMWLQFKLNPAQMDPTQQQIFSIMPWVMMFIMAPYASGLLLYWTFSNILSIAQQWYLYRKYDLTKVSDAQGAVPAKS